MFQGRSLLIATKHEKEKVLAPLFESALGVRCYTSSQLDTDIFGTFSGELSRQSSPLETVRDKCLWAIHQTDADLVLSSEGSFGSHPSLFFAHADEEWLMLIDKKNDIEIFVREISLETNFAASTVNNDDELNAFAEKYLFPEHGLVVKDQCDSPVRITKGIVRWEELYEEVHFYFRQGKNCYVETDMRAHMNPTRMKVIQKAGESLLQKIGSTCPSCQTPGFGVVKVHSGLPCEWCESPTKSTFSHVYECQKCYFQVEKKFPNQKTHESPEFCNYCNP